MTSTNDHSRRDFLGLVASACAAGLVAPSIAFAQPAPPPPAEADPRADFFKAAKVTKLAFTIKPADLESLRKDGKKYVRATVRENDSVVYPDVGVRLKGEVKRGKGIDEKPSLTLNADRFTDAQRFHGMDKLSLHIPRSDPSLVAALLAGDLYRSAKVAAPLSAHAIVTINGRPCGVYLLTEGFDEGYLKGRFGSTNGNLYEGDAKDVDQTLQVDAGKGDAQNQDDLRAVVDAARDGDHGNRLRRLGEQLDLDAFVGMLAVGAVVGDRGGYAPKRSNYRVYHDPKAKKCHFVQTDADGAWADPNAPLLPAYEGLVAKAIVETPEGRQRFLARVEAMVKADPAGEALSKRLTELQAKLQPALTAAGDAAAAKEYPTHVEALRTAIRQRAKNLAEQLAAAKK